ncbi:type IV pilus biogenesis/stability protein PilW [Derxia gummosa]|uniref:Type IV pilus biogenesis/stability protein PilW n=1 Tax=Derxia gummosa DSM 723 TaxID=1121388 RepID=A0A8B6X7Q3_9BURK|nr:type IV pilus biogenesis/stability protein PilW [Derxia gummosa]
MRYVGAALALLLLLSACVTQRSAPVERTTDIDSEEIVGQGKPAEARKRAQIRVELAANYYTENKFEVALQELKNAVSADPSYPEAYNLYGLVYMAIGEREKAEENFSRALRLAPNDSSVNTNYGWFLCRNGREKQSLPYFDAALKNPLYPTPSVPARSAGICAYRLGDYPLARNYLQRSFDSEPGNPTTMFHLSRTYLRLGDLERARFYAQRLNRQITPTAESLWLEVRIEHARGDRDAEVLALTQLRRQFPESREYAAFQRGDFNE